MKDLALPAPLELLARHATERPNDRALTHLRAGKPAQSWTWSELLKQALQARHRVEQLWSPGAIVPVYAGKSVNVVALMLGVMASGRTFAGINQKFRVPQVEQVLHACRAQAAITDSAGLSVIRDLVREEAGGEAMWWWLDAQQPNAVARASADLLGQAGRLQAWPPDAVDPAAQYPWQDSQQRLPDDRAAVCLFTSGSTGTPKGVLISWPDLYHRALAECELFSLSGHDVLLSVLPFSFDVGLNQLLSSWVSGAHLVVLDSWLPLDILRAVERFQVTGISGVPSIWLSLLKSPLTVDRAGSHRAWRYLTVSGGSMTAAQLQALAVRTAGVEVFKTYGQTESFRSTALLPQDRLQQPTSVGKPFGSANVYVVREDGSAAAPNELGEVVHTGLGVMLGYLNAPAGDRKRRANPFQGTADPSPYAIFTGDQGYLDEQGFLHLAGRQDDLVKIGGNRVHLAEVATQASMLAPVLAAEAVVVTGVEDEPSIVLFVLPQADARDLTVQQLRHDLSRRVPSYMHPKWIEVLPVFPLTASGKADRAFLKQRARELLLDWKNASEAAAPAQGIAAASIVHESARAAAVSIQATICDDTVSRR